MKRPVVINVHPCDERSRAGAALDLLADTHASLNAALTPGGFDTDLVQVDLSKAQIALLLILVESRRGGP